MASKDDSTPADRSIEADESTPLLSRKDNKANAKTEEQGLDRLQIFLLCLARAPEALAFFSIFSFVNQMVYEIGVPAAQVGFYTGLIESLLSVMQCITSPIWGRLSDTHGRKPLLVRSLFVLAISSTFFGLSTKIWHMILFRCISGIFSGSGVTIRTMVSEGSAPGAQARGFSLLAFASSVSILIAPLIGGGLAKPAEVYPIFRDVKLFVVYPYLLPCLVVGVISFLSGVATSLWLKETLKPRPANAPKEVPLSTFELLKSPGVPQVFSIYMLTFTLMFSYTAISPVFWFSPIDLGGFALSPQQISLMATLGGLGQTFFTLLVFPPLHARLGGKGILRIAALTWCIICIFWPSINFALQASMSKALFWTAASACALIASALSMSYPTVQMSLNNAAPPGAMGTLNGIAYSASIGTKAIFPALCSGLYAWGLDHKILKGQLAWAVLLIMAIGYAALVEIYPRETDEGKKVAEVDEEQESPSSD